MRKKQLLVGPLCLTLAASGGGILPTAVQADSVIATGGTVQFIGEYR